jgi:hypothetical protein
MRTGLLAATCVFALISSNAFACSLKFEDNVAEVDRNIGCRAAAQVEEFFENIGTPVTLNSHIKFLDFVKTRFESESGHSYRRVNGIYNAGTDVILVMSYREGNFGTIAFNLPVDYEVNYTFIVHELIHAGVIQLMGELYRNLSIGWHEVVAYCGQFTLAGDELRNQIFNGYDMNQTFQSELQVNDVMFFLADPADFAIKSYNFCTNLGVEETFRRVINLEVAQLNINF